MRTAERYIGVARLLMENDILSDLPQPVIRAQADAPPSVRSVLLARMGEQGTFTAKDVRAAIRNASEEARLPQVPHGQFDSGLITVQGPDKADPVSTDASRDENVITVEQADYAATHQKPASAIGLAQSQPLAGLFPSEDKEDSGDEEVRVLLGRLAKQLVAGLSDDLEAMQRALLSRRHQKLFVQLLKWQLATAA
jgi:hypothetical protein